MNRLGTAVFAAVEAVVAVGVGIGIALVPLSLLWGFEYGLQIPWVVFWRAAASVWLLGHGVDVTFVLDASAANATGLAGAGSPIVLTIAALGFALVTAWIGSRSGRRLAETEHRALGSVVAIASVVVLSLLIALSSISVASRPSLWQSIVLPALWFGVPLLVSAELARRRRSAPEDPVKGWLLDRFGRIPTLWRAVVAVALRGGVLVTAVLVAAAGVLVAGVVLGSYAEVITLYERSHAGVVGGLSITMGQLAFLPDFVGWAVAWIVGPGFAIGTGSSVSPISTTLGPIPGIPIFGALPAHGHAFGLLSVLVPVLAGFLVAAFVRPRLVRLLADADSALTRAIGGAGVGVVAGILTGLVVWVSSGAFGPGRLSTVGASPLVIGAFAALEVGVPAVVALGVGSDIVRMPDRAAWTVGRERWHPDGVEEPAAPVTVAHRVAHADAAEPGGEPTDVESRAAESRAAETDDDHVGTGPAVGGLIAALERAGAGRTTDVHRFTVEDREVGTSGRPASASTSVSTPAPAAASEPEREPEQVTEPDRERASSDRTAGSPDRVGRAQVALQRAGRGVRGRLRDGADRVRDTAGRVRDVADDVRERVSPERQRPVSPQAAGVGVDEQPGFPWRTEEFQPDHEDELPPTAPSTIIPPAAAPRAEPDRIDWDHTDEIPEHELPWWRKPKA